MTKQCIRLETISNDLIAGMDSVHHKITRVNDENNECSIDNELSFFYYNSDSDSDSDNDFDTDDEIDNDGNNNNHPIIKY